MMDEWIKQANEQAKKQAEALKQNNQYLIDQLNQSKNNTLSSLQEQQDNSIYNINSNKSTISSTAEDNARQLDVARLLALKSNQQSMNRAGLGTQGIVGSQVNSINNNYNSNLSSVLNDQSSALRDLDKTKNDTLLQYNTNRLNLENQYGDSLANLQAQIDDKALNQYNSVYSNYINQRQQEYDNQQAELARQEAIRQYNEQMEYQKKQDAIANAQKWATINAEQKKAEEPEFEDTLQSMTPQQFENLYSTYNWSDHTVKELFRWANGGYGKVTDKVKNSIVSNIEQNLKKGNLREDEADIILYALGIG